MERKRSRPTTTNEEWIRHFHKNRPYGNYRSTCLKGTTWSNLYHLIHQRDALDILLQYEPNQRSSSKHVLPRKIQWNKWKKNFWIRSTVLGISTFVMRKILARHFYFKLRKSTAIHFDTIDILPLHQNRHSL